MEGPEDATFELARFTWGAPDRLELAGSFVGVAAPPAEAAVLVVRGAERTHRLRPAPDGAPGADENGASWRADFAWQEVPEVVEVAQLRVGEDIVVDLPAPGAAEPQSLPVRRARADAGASGGPPPEAAAPAAGAERLRLESDLLAAQEQAGELRVAVERAHEDLARARADLQAEREGRAADAERFREGLAQMRASAEDALREAAETVRQRDAEVEELRGRLAAGAEELRDRFAGLDSARAVAAEARADAERLLARMETIRDALGDRE